MSNKKNDAAQGAEQTNQFETLVTDFFNTVHPHAIQEQLQSAVYYGIIHDHFTPTDSMELHYLHNFIKDLEKLMGGYVTEDF